VIIAIRRIALVTLLVPGVLVGALALAATSAPAAVSRYAYAGEFEGAGAPAGELSKPVAVAVDESSGDVYVVDRATRVVEMFDAQGDYLAQITGTPTGSAGSAEPFSEPTAIAVDNFPGPGEGDVYVVDEAHGSGCGSECHLPPIVDQFSSAGVYVGRLTGAGEVEGAGNSVPFGRLSGVAAGPGGELWLTEVEAEAGRGESAVLAFKQTGSSAEPWELALRFPDGFGVGVGGAGANEPLGIALDSSAHVYVAHGSPVSSQATLERWGISTVGGNPTLVNAREIAQVFKSVETNFNPFEAFGFTFAADLSTNDVFVDDETSNAEGASHIVRYGPFGEPEDEQFAYSQYAPGSLVDSSGIAVNGSTGVVYATTALMGENSNGHASGVSFYVEATPSAPAAVTGPAQTVAETTATVTGEVSPGLLPTTYKFEYGTSGPDEHTLPVAAGEGVSPVAVSAELGGLRADTTYHYRLVAENMDGTVYGQDQAFTSQPLPAPVAATGLVESVTQTSATLTATVEPHGLLTDYAFEVGGNTAYGGSIPGVIPGSTSETVRLVLTNLVAGTTYHYRLVASNEGGLGTGEDRSFTTAAPLFAPALVPAQPVASGVAQKPKGKVSVAPKPKPLTRAQKLAKALRTCAKDKSRSKHAACVKRARQNYAAPKKSRKK
jgi:hypothetical protein